MFEHKGLYCCEIERKKDSYSRDPQRNICYSLRKESRLCCDCSMQNDDTGVIAQADDLDWNAEEFAVFTAGDSIATAVDWADERLLFVFAVVDIKSEAEACTSDEHENDVDNRCMHWLEMNCVDLCSENEIVFRKSADSVSREH